MSQERYANVSLSLAMIILGVYALNLTWMKLIQDTSFLSGVQEFSGQGFQGFEGPIQFLLLLLMALFFTITIVLKKKADENAAAGVKS